MKHEVISEVREIAVNVRLTDDAVPVITSARGYKFQPKTLHTLWARENADEWRFVCVELKGILPKSGRRVTKTYWSNIAWLPGWIGAIVTATSPLEASEGITS